MIGFSKFFGSGFWCLDLILLGFCVQMLNEKMLKFNMYKTGISTETENYKYKQKVATDKKRTLWKMDLKFS